MCASCFFPWEAIICLIAGSTRPTQHASELLPRRASRSSCELLAPGRGRSVVLIDLPPVLLTDDALVVAPKVDADVVVASEGVTGRARFSGRMRCLVGISKGRCGAQPGWRKRRRAMITSYGFRKDD